MSDDIKQRRKALGWSREELSRRSQVDKRIVQLLELGESRDEESLKFVLDALQAGEEGTNGVD